MYCTIFQFLAHYVLRGWSPPAEASRGQNSLESRQLPELEILSNGSMEIKHIQIPTPAAPRPIPQMGKVIQNPPTYLVGLYTCILLLSLLTHT